MIGLPLLRSPQQLRSRIKSWRAFGETVALVPVEGPPHEGHAALVRAAQREADRVLAALLPEDAGDGADDAPNPHEGATERLMDEAGADALYAPSRAVFRPLGRSTTVHVPGLSDVMDGEDSPAALDGFAADLVRLFAQAQPDSAMFSEMAWQRRLIARRIAQDFGLCERVLAADAARDDDGVAACIDRPAARPAAARLWRELRRAAAAISGGADVDATLDAAADALSEAGIEVDYLDLRDAETLDELDRPDPARDARIFAAVEASGARISDNVAL